MKVLAFDTALAACSAAVWADGEILAARFERLERGHAEALMPMVEAVRAEAGVAYDDIDLLAVTVGPGTFTGIRIGLAAARGLALASGLALAGVTTLEAVAAGVDEAVRGGEPVLAVLDARRDQVYAQAFTAVLDPLGEPCLAAPGAAASLLADGRGVVVGTGARLVRAHRAGLEAGLRFPAANEFPDAKVVAAIAAGRGVAAGAPPSPLYLRPPDAKPPGPARAAGR